MIKQNFEYKRGKGAKPMSLTEQKQALQKRCLYFDPKDKSAILQMVDDIQGRRIKTAIIVSSVHKIPQDRATRESVEDIFNDYNVDFIQTHRKII